MKKIPTVFRRDPDDMRHVTSEVHPDCQWVLDGEGTPTRKYDGTCVMFDGTRWWARREVKPGKTAPNGFEAISASSSAVVRRITGMSKPNSLARSASRSAVSFFLLRDGESKNTLPVWMYVETFS